MNYIELINWFWICDEVWEFTATETRLYMYLLKVANALSWQQNPFWHSDGKTSIGARCSINSMKTARNRIVQAGLIKVEPGGKGYGNKSRYQILTPKSIPNHIPKHEPKPIPKHAPLIKLKETKLNLIPPLVPPGEKTGMIKFEIPDLEKTRAGMDNSPPIDTDLAEYKRKKVPAKKEKTTDDPPLDLPFASGQFAQKWNVLAGLQKWKKKPPECLREALGQLAKYPEEFAIELVELAISGNYQAVTFPNTAQKFEQWKLKTNAANYKSNKLHSQPSPGKYDDYRL